MIVSILYYFCDCFNRKRRAILPTYDYAFDLYFVLLMSFTTNFVWVWYCYENAHNIVIASVNDSGMYITTDIIVIIILLCVVRRHADRCSDGHLIITFGLRLVAIPVVLSTQLNSSYYLVNKLVI